MRQCRARSRDIWHVIHDIAPRPGKSTLHFHGCQLSLKLASTNCLSHESQIVFALVIYPFDLFFFYLVLNLHDIGIQKINCRKNSKHIAFAVLSLYSHSFCYMFCVMLIELMVIEYSDIVMEHLWCKRLNVSYFKCLVCALGHGAAAVGHLRFTPTAGPIVASWLCAACFSGSLISLEEKRMSTSERSSAGSQDRIKWSPLLHRELLLHLHKAAPPSQDDYFWQCLSQEGTFADLMGPGPLYAAFWMAPCHHLWTERKKMNWGCCLKWISNKSVVFKWSWMPPIYFPQWRHSRRRRWASFVPDV